MEWCFTTTVSNAQRGGRVSLNSGSGPRIRVWRSLLFSISLTLRSKRNTLREDHKGPHSPHQYIIIIIILFCDLFQGTKYLQIMLGQRCSKKDILALFKRSEYCGGSSQLQIKFGKNHRTVQGWEEGVALLIISNVTDTVW